MSAAARARSCAAVHSSARGGYHPAGGTSQVLLHVRRDGAMGRGTQIGRAGGAWRERGGAPFPTAKTAVDTAMTVRLRSVRNRRTR